MRRRRMVEQLILAIILRFLQKPPNIENQLLPPCIGVFRLCTGNDRLDVLSVSDINIGFCGILRCGSRVDSMDDNSRTIFTRTTAKCNGYSRISQLDGELRRWNRFSHFTSEFSE